MTRKRVSRPLMACATLVLGAALIGVAIVGATVTDHHGSPAARDMVGNPVTAETWEVQEPSGADKADVDTSTGLRFSVAEVGLDVPLAAMNEVDRVITPPGFKEAYWIRNIGADPMHTGSGTVFVVMHSLRGGAIGPGNFIIDAERGTPRVGIGASVFVAGTEYRVSQTLIVKKHDLPYRSDIWADTPDRLVVVTCLQHADGRPSASNVVIIAERV